MPLHPTPSRRSTDNDDAPSGRSNKVKASLALSTAASDAKKQQKIIKGYPYDAGVADLHEGVPKPGAAAAADAPAQLLDNAEAGNAGTNPGPGTVSSSKKHGSASLRVADGDADSAGQTDKPSYSRARKILSQASLRSFSVPKELISKLQASRQAVIELSLREGVTKALLAGPAAVEVHGHYVVNATTLLEPFVGYEVKCMYGLIGPGQVEMVIEQKT